MFGEIQRNSTVTVVHLRVLGAQIRTLSDDAGFTLGASDRLYLLPSTAQTRPGSYWFHVPLPAESESLAVASRALGIDISVRPPEFDLTLGVKQHVLLASVPAAASVKRMLRFDLESPELSTVKANEACASC